MPLVNGNKYALATNTVANTATLILPEDPSRRGLFMTNLHASATMYFGGSGVTTSSYLFKLDAGQSISDTLTRDALYAIVASGTASLAGFGVS